MKNKTSFPIHPATPIGKNGSDQIATININGITSRTREEMLEGFFRQSDIDIIFLREVTRPNLDVFRGYKTHHNVGTRMRGTAIVTGDEIRLSNKSETTVGSGDSC